MPDKKIVIKKKPKVKAKKYDASKDEMGNLLPEAEVRTYTGSEAAQRMKRNQDKRRDRRNRIKKQIEDILKRREEKGKA